jgi:hypothetical protein
MRRSGLPGDEFELAVSSAWNRGMLFLGVSIRPANQSVSAEGPDCVKTTINDMILL